MVRLGAGWRKARTTAEEILRIDREAGMLPPPSIGEWVGEDHRARFVVEIVEELDLNRGWRRRIRGSGWKAYPPSMLLVLLFCRYAKGVYSSRELKAATNDSVAFRFVAGDLHPDHDTIATSRRRFQGEVSDLFVQILGFAQAMGILRLGQVSLDGTKVKANASKRKAMIFAYPERLEKPLRAAAAFSELTERADSDAVDVDLPEELRRREDRLGVIAAAKVEMERRAALRHEAEMEEHRAKMAAREEKQRKTGKKTGGPPPKEPEPDSGPKDQVNSTDPVILRIIPARGGDFSPDCGGLSKLRMSQECGAFSFPVAVVRLSVMPLGWGRQARPACRMSRTSRPS